MNGKGGGGRGQEEEEDGMVTKEILLNEIRIVPDRLDFPDMEDRLLRLWKELNAFQTSMRLSKGTCVRGVFSLCSFWVSAGGGGQLLGSAGSVLGSVRLVSYPLCLLCTYIQE